MTTRHRRAPRAHRSRARRTGHAGTALLILFGLLVATVALAVLSGNYQIRPVLSGSMRPGLPVGGVVITHRVPLDDVKVRDVIVFTRPDNPSEMVVHRVIELTRTGRSVTIRTQGDANDTADPWTLNLHGTTAYRAVYSLPLVGYPAVWLHNLSTAQRLSYLAGLALLLGAVSMWRTDRRRRARHDTEADAVAEDAVAKQGVADDIVADDIVADAGSPGRLSATAATPA